MKKSHIGIAAIIAVLIAAGAYFFITKQSDVAGGGLMAGKSELLSFVPADTPYFLGGLTPIDTNEWRSMYNNMPQMGMNKEQLEELFGGGERMENLSPGARLMLGVYAEYMNDLGQGESFLDVWGMNGELSSAIYSVGLLPVMRLDMPNREQLSKRIRAVEQEYNIEPELKQAGDVSYRRYSFTQAVDGPGAIVIAENDNTLVVTMEFEGIDQAQLDMALGATKPNKSLGSKRLASLAKQYGFDKRILGFIDHQAIATGFTTADGNALAVDLTDVLSGSSEVAQLRTPACAQAFSDLTDTMPQTVLGYNTLDLQANPARMDMLMSFEINDSEIMDGLKRLRGDLPPSLFSLTGEQKMSFGMGVNVDALSEVIGLFNKRISDQQTDCAVLAEMQQGFSGDAQGLTMMTAFVAGLRGVSASIFDMEGSFPSMGGALSIESMDALVAISANNPKTLLTLVMSMAPMLQGMPIPESGDTIDVPLPMPPGINVSTRLKLTDNHIFLFTGSKSEQAANELDGASLGEHGFYAMAIDYAWYFETLMGALDGQLEYSPGYDPKAMASMTEWFEQVDMKIAFNLGATDDGVVLDLDASMKTQ